MTRHNCLWKTVLQCPIKGGRGGQWEKVHTKVICSSTCDSIPCMLVCVSENAAMDGNKCITHEANFLLRLYKTLSTIVLTLYSSRSNKE